MARICCGAASEFDLWRYKIDKSALLASPRIRSALLMLLHPVAGFAADSGELSCDVDTVFVPQPKSHVGYVDLVAG